MASSGDRDVENISVFSSPLNPYTFTRALAKISLASEDALDHQFNVPEGPLVPPPEQKPDRG